MKQLYFTMVKYFSAGELISEDHSILFRGIKKSVIVQVISYFFVFVNSIMLVRLAGVENYGVYVNLFNWISVLTIIGCFGMEDVVLAEIPLYLQKNSTGHIRNLINRANKLIFIVSVLVALLFAIIVSLGFLKGFSESSYLFLISLVNVYFAAFIIVNQQALQAFNRFYVSQGVDKIIRPLLLTIIIGGFWLARKNIDVQLLVLSNTAVFALAAIIIFGFLRSTVAKLPASRSNDHVEKERFRDNGYFLLISLFFLLKSRIGMLILGGLNEPTSVGILNVAYRLSDLVLLPFILIHSVVPQLFSSRRETDATYRRKLFDKATLLTTIGSLIIVLFFIIFGRFVLKLYDDSFGQYVDILLILCGSQFLYSLFGPSNALLMMQGKQKQAAFALLADIILNCLLLFLFINWLGLTGVALASFCGSLFYNIVLRILVNRHLSEKLSKLKS